jgi:hypothetical protein
MEKSVFWEVQHGGTFYLSTSLISRRPKKWGEFGHQYVILRLEPVHYLIFFFDQLRALFSHGRHVHRR